MLELFDRLSLLEACNVEPQLFVAVVAAVRAATPDNPLSNWWHSVSSVQALAVFLAPDQGGAGDKMPPEDALALLLAALCRNLEHPGVTNAFLVRTRDPRAVAARTGAGRAGGGGARWRRTRRTSSGA